jgi:hypothetical protein
MSLSREEEPALPRAKPAVILRLWTSIARTNRLIFPRLCQCTCLPLDLVEVQGLASATFILCDCFVKCRCQKLDRTPSLKLPESFDDDFLSRCKSAAGDHFINDLLPFWRQSDTHTCTPYGKQCSGEQGTPLGYFSFAQIAWAISRVPTAVGSLRSGFRS